MGGQQLDVLAQLLGPAVPGQVQHPVRDGDRLGVQFLSHLRSLAASGRVHRTAAYRQLIDALIKVFPGR
jgi:hypothetical protein